MSRRERLIELAGYARGVQSEFIGDLGPEERAAVGAPDRWSAKDIVAHLTAWRRRGLDLLRAAEAGTIPEEIREFDEMNLKHFLESRDLSWDQVLAQADEVWEAFVTGLAGLPEILLSDPPPSAESSGPPLWRRLTVDGANHPVFHFAEHAFRYDRGEAAVRWVEGLSPLLLALDSSDDWQGVVHYNLACQYALAGMSGRALAGLKTALALRPSLGEWAPQDPDLRSLHDDPRFLELLGSLGPAQPPAA